MNPQTSGTASPPTRGRWDEVSVRPVWDLRAGPAMMNKNGGEVFCVQTPGMPLMAMRRTGTRIEIGWEGDDGFNVEVAASTRMGEVWKPVNQHPRRWANLNLVVLEAARGEQYFRLRRCPANPAASS